MSNSDGTEITLATALCTPYRSRTLVRTNAARVTESGLRQAVVAAQAVLVALCAARVATDYARGQASLEGVVAFALFVIVTMRLAAQVFGATPRNEMPSLGETPYRSSMLRTVAQKNLRSR